MTLPRPLSPQPKGTDLSCVLCGPMIVPLQGGFSLDQSVGQVQFIVHTLSECGGLGGQKVTEGDLSSGFCAPSNTALMTCISHCVLLCLWVHLSLLPLHSFPMMLYSLHPLPFLSSLSCLSSVFSLFYILPLLNCV